MVAALLSQESEGAWAEQLLASDALIGPHHLPAEVAGALRRTARAGEISDDVASIAFSEMLAMNLELQPFAPFAGRIWQLRNTVSIVDAWYVAIAEALDSPLATLDLRLTRVPGPRCRFLTPPSR
jgi:predicted nucleic acid-binding protein